MSLTLGYAQTTRALVACLKAGRVAYLVGSPGTGKTTCVRAAGVALGLPVVELIASNCDATDIAGIPYQGNGELHRSLLPEIYRATREPVILFLDEITCIPKSVEGPLLRLALERVAGSASLHAGTRIVVAGNPPDQAPGGLQLSAALINRVVQIPYAPSITEVAGFFAAHSPIGADFAATLAAKPDLVQMDPPAASVDSGAAWGSPRAWQIGLECWQADGLQEDETGEAILAGAVGDNAALAYLSIRRLRAHLPTAQQIIDDPTTTKVPDRDHQIAALGLLACVAATDAAAAWLYAARLQPEYAAAAAKGLVSAPWPKASPWLAIGRAAQVRLYAALQRAAS